MVFYLTHVSWFNLILIFIIYCNLKWIFFYTVKIKLVCCYLPVNIAIAMFKVWLYVYSFCRGAAIAYYYGKEESSTSMESDVSMPFSSHGIREVNCQSIFCTLVYRIIKLIGLRELTVCRNCCMFRKCLSCVHA